MFFVARNGLLACRKNHDPHRDPHAETEQRKKECRTGDLRLLSVFFLCLYDLFYESSHCLGRFVLILPSSVGVGAEDKFDIVVEADVKQPDALQELLVKVYLGVRKVHFSGKRRGGTCRDYLNVCHAPGSADLPLFADCCRRTMIRAVSSENKSIVFPLIFSWEYHIPREEAIWIVGQAIMDFIQ